MYLSLEQKIGQLIVVGFHGTSPQDPCVQALAARAGRGEIGGTILFGYNVEDPDQLKTLTTYIGRSAAPLPLFIFADQEGGRVQRLNADKGFKDFLSARQVAQTLDTQEAVHHYREMGIMLKNSGINVDFAPCADLDGEPPCPVIGGLDRSYSAVTSDVVRFAGAMADGLSRAHVLNCIKHFPGHGRATGDSHAGLVDVTDTWTREELAPFSRLIRRGGIDAVMTAHIIHNGIDPGMPASLSSRWMDSLRNDVGFQGLVVPDDLHMGAIIRQFSLEEVVVRGLAAGLDLLLFSNNPLAARTQGVRHDTGAVPCQAAGIPDDDLPDKIIAIVKKALLEGRLKMSRIDEALSRVMPLKSDLNPGENGAKGYRLD